MNIRPLGFLDTWAFSAMLHGRHKDKFSGDHHSYSSIQLRDHDRAMPIMAEWKSARALLTRMTNSVAPLFGNEVPDLGAVDLVRLKAGGVIEWSVEDPSDWLSLYLNIVPAPGAWLYAGGEAAVLPVGQLTLVNRQVLHSAINLSNHPCITLVAHVRKTDDPLGELD